MQAPVPAPVPGSVDTFDAQTYRALADAQAAINSIKSDIANGKLTATPTIKAVLNQAIMDYNAANVLWQQYHASGGKTAQAPITAATNKVQTDVGQLVTTGGGQ